MKRFIFIIIVTICLFIIGCNKITDKDNDKSESDYRNEVINDELNEDKTNQDVLIENNDNDDSNLKSSTDESTEENNDLIEDVDTYVCPFDEETEKALTVMLRSSYMNNEIKKVNPKDTPVIDFLLREYNDRQIYTHSNKRGGCNEIKEEAPREPDYNWCSDENREKTSLCLEYMEKIHQGIKEINEMGLTFGDMILFSLAYVFSKVKNISYYEYLEIYRDEIIPVEEQKSEEELQEFFDNYSYILDENELFLCTINLVYNYEQAKNYGTDYYSYLEIMHDQGAIGIPPFNLSILYTYQTAYLEYYIVLDEDKYSNDELDELYIECYKILKIVGIIEENNE